MGTASSAEAGQQNGLWEGDPRRGPGPSDRCRRVQGGCSGVWVCWRSRVSLTTQHPAVSPAPPHTAGGSELGFKPPQPPACWSCPAGGLQGGKQQGEQCLLPPCASPVLTLPSCHHHPHAISLSSRGWAPPCDSRARFCPHPGLLQAAAGFGHAQGVQHVQPQTLLLPVPSSWTGDVPSSS